MIYAQLYKTLKKFILNLDRFIKKVNIHKTEDIIILSTGLYEEINKMKSGELMIILPDGIYTLKVYLKNKESFNENQAEVVSYQLKHDIEKSTINYITEIRDIFNEEFLKNLVNRLNVL
jgi:hypothetical protein